MFYDPLGLISPITLPIEIILQKLFELKFEWDTNIDADTSHLWKQYIRGLKHVSSVSVNRHVLCCERSLVQLRGFCDSSEKAYCAVVYARVLCNHGVNPADVAARVMSPRKFAESELWWKGPKFLTCEKEIRPVQEIEVDNKKSLVEAEEKQTVALVVVEGSVCIEDVIDCRRFGKLRRLLNVTSYVDRF